MSIQTTETLISPRRLSRVYDASVGHGNQIHVKSLVVDSWGSDPTVALGSANFSDESVHDNDENTLLLRGNRWAAAVTATEFLRVFTHYRFRHRIKALANAYDTTPLNPLITWTLGEDTVEPNWLIPPEAVESGHPDNWVLGVTANNVWLDETGSWLLP